MSGYADSLKRSEHCMAILVTGAFGCIGAWVVKRLLAALGDDPWRMRSLQDGIGKTLEEFEMLQKGGRLDARELEPATT